MTRGRPLGKELPVEEVKRLVRETMLSEEEVVKNLDQLSRIMELFDEIDSFEEYAKSLEPLYHPLDQRGEPRVDESGGERARLEEFVKNVRDGFLRTPRL
ncbi:MAG TPA: hypothetical protein EYH45_08205 [Candidatus Caldiarchaeum subterraneum]|uniref:Asp-tRNA(Asn)/Glu-tRNA(Gln) amidotransferase subunit GatC n=1 Tax=Caldiarchaeum subterraneum TaxID=311458 RepID=A0A832ZXD6_CALS0|nr:hypothetical protein [Aigarchaeota archaeon]HIQ30523.1 hypothetical protein [Candidatus Caldarchaeum subterraneum]